MTPSTSPKEPVSLANYDEVAAIVEAFAKNIGAISDRLATGEADSDETQKAVQDRVDAIAAIFRGENPGYTLAEWNAEGRLAGKIIGWKMGLTGQRDPIAGFFARLAIRILNTLRAAHEGMADDEAGPRIHAALREATNRLAGVRP